MRVKLHRLDHGRGLARPDRASPGSAGYDLRAALGEPLRLEPGARRLVPCGIRLEIPPGWEGQVRPRSGLALRHGVTVLNSPGTIDSDYRGEIGVVLANLGREDFVVRPGSRIAQLVFAPVTAVEWQEVDALARSERGGGGFGSSGDR